MRPKKTENFAVIEEFLRQFREATGGSPTVKEIEAGTGIPHSTVSRYLNEMKDQGVIDFNGHRNIVTRKEKAMFGNSMTVPVIGSIACGQPNFAEENIEEYVQLPVSLFGKGDFYLLRAFGESMIEAGIDEGDLVLVRKQQTAAPGDIVVALVEDEATLKRFYPEPQNHRIRLHPENSSMEDFYVESCQIQGIAVNVIKALA